MALVSAWNRTGMEIKGRDDLNPTARTLYMCVSVWAVVLAAPFEDALPNSIFSVNDAYLTDLHSSTNLLQSLARGIFSHVLNFAAEQDAAASQRSPTVTSSHVLSSTE